MSVVKIFSCELDVRGYELDSYGHVNNAVYLNYAEYARWCMIKEVAGSMDYFKNHGVAPVVARVEIDYKRPCFMGERLTIQTRLLEHKKKISVFEHTVLKPDGVIATRILATLVVVNAEGRAVDMPTDFKDIFSGSSP